MRQLITRVLISAIGVLAVSAAAGRSVLAERGAVTTAAKKPFGGY